MRLFKNNLRVTNTFAAALLLTTSVLAQDATTRPDMQSTLEAIKTQAVVGFDWLDEPLDRILLLRLTNGICAIKFVSFQQDASGGFFAELDTLYQKNPGAQFDTNKTQYAHVKLEQFAAIDLGVMTINRGTTEFRCGNQKLLWLYPTGVRIGNPGSNIYLAPTAWTSFPDVRLDDPGLRWYPVDATQSRAIQRLPLDRLPTALPNQ